MVTFNNGKIETTPLGDIMRKPKFVPEDLWRSAPVFFAQLPNPRKS
jgi:hypothetical protein